MIRLRFLPWLAVLGTLACDPAANRTPKPDVPPTTAQPGSDWELVWQDEFDGPAGTSPSAERWVPDVGGDGWGNEQLEFDTARPENVSLDGTGNLVITARKESTAHAWPEDRRTPRFTLREGVRWSDGKPFTAEDVDFTFQLLKKHPALDAGSCAPRLGARGGSGDVRPRRCSRASRAGCSSRPWRPCAPPSASRMPRCTCSTSRT